MRLFGKSKKLELTTPQEKWAERMADRICRIQRRLATYLNVRTTKLDKGTWMVLLALFCLLTGAYCSYLVIQAFN